MSHWSFRLLYVYSHESWTIKEVNLRAFGVGKRKVQRKILGGKEENGI